MAAKRAPRWFIIGIACLLCANIPTASAATDPLSASKLDNATCQTCHDGSKSALSITDDKGKKRALHDVCTDKMAKSVHAKMQCVDCHKDITNR